MAGGWKLVRERFPLSGLKALSAVTGGASDIWYFNEPSVGAIRKALDDAKAQGGGKTDVDILIEDGVVDSDGSPAFGGENPEFTDLSGPAATELTEFAYSKIVKTEEEESPGK